MKRVPIRETIKSCDIILEVLDARNIEGTKLPRLEALAGKRILKIANKADLASSEIVSRLVRMGFVLVHSKARNLTEERKKLLKAILAQTEQRPLRVFVIGYPNVGKSTIINLLAGRNAARASPIAGTTTNIQWIRVSPEVLLIDSPGVFPMKETHSSLLKKGAMNVNSLKDPELHATQLASRCIADRVLRRWVSRFFDISVDKDDAPEVLIEKIARRRNWLLKGGELNILEASKALLRAQAKAPK